MADPKGAKRMILEEGHWRKDTRLYIIVRRNERSVNKTTRLNKLSCEECIHSLKVATC